MDVKPSSGATTAIASALRTWNRFERSDIWFPSFVTSSACPGSGNFGGEIKQRRLAVKGAGGGFFRGSNADAQRQRGRAAPLSVLSSSVKTTIAAAVLAASLLMLSPRSAHADGLPVAPGLWEVVWTMPDPLGREPVRQKNRACVRDRIVTAERVNSMMHECRISNAVFAKASAKWRMRCDTPAGPVDGTGSLRSNGTLVTGSVDLAMSIGGFEVPATSTFRARRVGDCPVRRPGA
jgi:hypothetical protein